jgi:hypothetical protein
MNPKEKVLLYFIGLAAVCALCLVIYKQNQMITRQNAIEKEIVAQRDLANDIQRSMSEYSTKNDLKVFIADSGLNLKSVEQDLSKLSADVLAANKVVVISNGQNKTDVPSTSSTPDASPTVVANGTDPNKYYENTQSLKLNENFADVAVPVGQVSFDASKQKPWTIEIPQRDYQLTTVLGEDADQRIYAYNQFSIMVDGKKYDVKINDSKIVQQYPDAKFSWWNPRVSFGMSGGLTLNGPAADAAVGLTFSPFSYGRYKKSPDWLFLNVGPDYSLTTKKVGVEITPASYNLHQVLPILNNTYVGPSLSVDTSQNMSILGTLSVSF